MHCSVSLHLLLLFNHHVIVHTIKMYHYRSTLDLINVHFVSELHEQKWQSLQL